MLAPVRVLVSLVPVVLGCRIDFDARPVTDAPRIDAGLAFGVGCAVGLALDEPAWTGAPGEVRDACAGNHGTAAGDAVRVEDPARGAVGALPLPAGCIKIPDAASLHATTGLTISAWVYPQALDGVNPYGIVAKRTDFEHDDAEYTLFAWTDNTVWFDLDSRNDRSHGATPLVNGRWQQVTLVYDGTRPMAQRVTLYIDGAIDAVLPETSATLTAYPSTLSIGCLPDPPDMEIALGGRIDDVGIWTRAFSTAEVLAWYDATRR
jgi:hypothetical protein